MAASSQAGLRWRPGFRSFRSKLLALVALAVSIPALLTCIILGFQLNRQARGLFTQELAAKLETFSLIIEETENNLHAGLIRVAADNTLQITLDLAMRSQLAGYIDAQREVLQVGFLAVFDSGERLMASALAPRSVAGPWRLSARIPSDGAGCTAGQATSVQLVDCDGTVYLVSVVRIVRAAPANVGDAAAQRRKDELGYLLGGIALASPRFIEALQSRKIEHPLLWVNGRLIYSNLPNSPIVLPARHDGSLLEYTDVDAAYLWTAREKSVGPTTLVYAALTELAPLRTALFTSVLAVAAVGALIVAVALVTVGILANRLLRPIGELREGAARIGGGDLNQRISVRSSDELSTLADQFNNMAERLQDSYAMLERKVEERTSQLALANRHKSRFIAAASHDLRQPLHALNLFVAQLRTEQGPAERNRLVGRIDAAVSAMNDLFNALLDMSKLDVDILEPHLEKVAVAHLFRRLESTFAGAAREKGLRLELLASELWVETDPILLERIMLNLVSNAVRYTQRGGVLIGCRRRGSIVRFEVWDTGVGIPEDQHRNIFREFVRLAEPGREAAGLGLGLSIVERLCQLLGYRLAVTSRPGRGSCFSVEVPLAAGSASEEATRGADVVDPIRGKLIVVIDDDRLVLDGMQGILRSWGCTVIATASVDDALAEIADRRRQPDVIVSDYQLGDGRTGIDAILALRQATGRDVPAFLISGDTSPERLRQAGDSGHDLIHKPVPPTVLRAMLNQMLRGVRQVSESSAPKPLAASIQGL